MSEPSAAAAARDRVRIGLVSVSDRASAGVYEDKGIPALQAWLSRAVSNPIEWETRLVPDEKERISACYFVPTQWQVICAVPDIASRDLSALRRISWGASVAPPSVLRYRRYPWKFVSVEAPQARFTVRLFPVHDAV